MKNRKLKTVTKKIVDDTKIYFVMSTPKEQREAIEDKVLNKYKEKSKKDKKKNNGRKLQNN
jgi:hypothetical protein